VENAVGAGGPAQHRNILSKRKTRDIAWGFDIEREISRNDGSSRRYDERNASVAALDVGSADIVSMQISKIMVV
jgi:hypothetical protein